MKRELPTHRHTIASGIGRFMVGHRTSLVGGVIAALVVVGARIALPWSLKAAVNSFAHHAASIPGTTSQVWTPTLSDPLVLQAAGFLFLLVIMGYADYRERLCFARFAIGLVHDLRSSAADTLRRRLSQNSLTSIHRGDAIARLIGDTARIKAGVKGFLVHVATNGVMFLGVALVLCTIDPMLGVVFGIGGLFIAAVTWRGAWAIYYRAAKYRAKEGSLAETIHSVEPEHVPVGSFTSQSSESASHEARITLLQGRTTWAVHALFGVTVLVCLWLGIRGVYGGRIDASNMVIFVLYALMMRAPLVQLARQGVRTGKIVASLERVLEIVNLDELDAADATDQLPALREGIQINGLRVRRGKGALRRTCLRVDSLHIKAGQRIAIVGRQGSGKSTLVQVVGGVVPCSSGQIFWDGNLLAVDKPSQSLRRQTCLLSALPSWSRKSLRDVLAAPANMPDEAVIEVIAACGARKVVDRWSKGIHTKISSRELSLGECRQIALASTLISATLGPSVLLIDDMTSGMSKSVVNKMIAATFKYAQGRTVLMCFARPAKMHKFDRVIELKNGRIVLDADPQTWRQQRNVLREQRP